MRFPNSVKPSFGSTWPRTSLLDHRPADRIQAPPNNLSILLGKATFGYAVLHLFIYLRSRIGGIFSSFWIKKVCLSRMPRSQSTKNCTEIPSFSPSALSNISCFVLLVSISYLLLPWRPKATFNCFVPRLNFFSSNLMNPLIRQTTSFQLP
jgi:hypothetical protein